MSDIEEKAGVIKQVTEVFPEPTQEANKALTTIGKTINLALVPLSGLIWGYDKISSWIGQKLSDRLANIPEDNIITPPINIAGPTIDAMRFTSDDELREMYANLLATSMNNETASKVHPRFVEVIKNLTSDEAFILKYFFDNKIHYINKYSFQEYGSTKQWNYYSHNNISLIRQLSDIDLSNLEVYMDNFCHLGIFEIKQGFIPGEIEGFKLINEFPDIALDIKLKVNVSRTIKYVKTYTELLLTSFGHSFMDNVVKSK